VAQPAHEDHLARAYEADAVDEAAVQAAAQLRSLTDAQRQQNAAARVAELIRPLTEDEGQIFHRALADIPGGLATDIIARVNSNVCQRASMQTLRPGTWLSDEVIQFFYIILAKQDEAICRRHDANGRKRSHFFKSFFMTKLLNEGHKSRPGLYEYSNVRRWSRKVPGMRNTGGDSELD
jgi:hypothetical protein